MNCPNCQRPNDPAAMTCAYCGAMLAAPISQGNNPFADQGTFPNQPIYQQYPTRKLEDEPGMRFILPVGRSIHAIIAGYLGLFSLALCFLGPFAILFGVLAIMDIRKNPKKSGMVRASLGIVCGLLGSVALVMFLIAILTQA
jgi:hypothetical protein